jgi:hypothetical protein
MTSFIRAKYEGRCSDCGRRMPVGTLIAWKHGASREVRCIECEDVRSRQPMFMAHADRHERDDYYARRARAGVNRALADARRNEIAAMTAQAVAHAGA